MKAKDLMSRTPATCTPDASVEQAARLMEDHDCGCLPVVEEGSGSVVGVVTDRDIAMRAVARGKAPQTRVLEVMSPDPSCCRPDDDLETVERIMAERQVRRVPIIDEAGRCVGMIAQADLARKDVPEREVARTVERISEPTSAPRREAEIGVQLGRTA